jgi:serine phosphatase RsbU (regulator of sigma subunit)/pSer/pThr/pTyr-binding forkhead associated (FHA) protein
MNPVTGATPGFKPAALFVFHPGGGRTRVALTSLPFRIGRQSDNDLVLRDNRISRNHAVIEADGEGYCIRDLASRLGVYVNGTRIAHQRLLNADQVHFGPEDSYRLVFTFEEEEIQRLLAQVLPHNREDASRAPALAQLGALVEVARAVETSLTSDDVLSAVVDAALRITRTERGFLLLASDDTLDVRVARDTHGQPLSGDELRVPRSLIHRALRNRREFLSMDLTSASPLAAAECTVADLELRGVVAVPLVRARSAATAAPRSEDSWRSETVGVLYLDSRAGAADLSWGNRELLETLALEASTIIENARLLEENRARQRMEEELRIARQIQQSLLPRHLPQTGWLRAAGATVPSYQVGGDYFDVRPAGPDAWSLIVVDVSGKGASSALLASLIQGAFLGEPAESEHMASMPERLNAFLCERTAGEKFATLFYCRVARDGTMHWINAGHCAPLVLGPDASLTSLDSTSLPIGMIEDAEYVVSKTRLAPGSKILIYSDGVSEALNQAEEYFTERRVRECLRESAKQPCAGVLTALSQAVAEFSAGTVQADDITILAVDFQPD